MLGVTIGPIEGAKHAGLVGDDQRFADRRCQPVQPEAFRRLAGHGAPFQQPEMRARTPRDAARRRRARAAIARHGRAARPATAARPLRSRIARSRPISAAGNASGSRSSRMAMYCAVHSPIPASERNCVMASSRLRRGPKISGSATTAAASDDSAVAPGVRHADRRQIRLGQSPRRRKHVRQSLLESGRIVDCLAEARTPVAGEPGRRRHRDLLPENGAHRELEAVPRAGHPQARPSGDQRRQRRVLAEMRADRHRIGGQIEHPANARDDRRQGPQIWQANGCLEAVLLRRARPPRRRDRRRSRSCGRSGRPTPPRRREWRGRAGTPAWPPSRRAADSRA